MKRVLVLILIALCIVLSSCDLLPVEEEPQDQHIHTWDEGSFTVVPTCTTDGEKVYVCSVCNETRSEVIPASEEYHNWGNGEEITAPKCTTKGERKFTCQNCNATKTIEIDELGHLWDEGTIQDEATAEQDGTMLYHCKREGCDATKTETYHVHSWGSPVILKAATCSIDGEMQYTCARCGETKIEAIPADGVSHSFATDWYKNETHHWHLSNCGHIIPMAQSAGYAEHVYCEPEILTPATCTTEGSRKLTCTVCGYSVTETYTDENNHTYSEQWSSDENQHWHVVTCGHEATSVKEDHVFDDGVETKTGSCTTDGEITYTCTVCGYSYTEAIPKEEYHDVDTSTNTCKICNEVFYFNAAREANKSKITLRAAFMNSGLTDLTIPRLVPNWNYTRWFEAEVISSVSTKTLESITIPEGVTTIAYQAFKDKTNLHTVNLPESLTTIEQEAFMSCTALTSIHIPASVTFIGTSGFAYCTALTDIYFGGTNAEWATLLTGAKNILQGTSATVHCSDD